MDISLFIIHYKINSCSILKSTFSQYLSLLKYIPTACPRVVVPRRGHPLRLIEYIIEIVYQVFLPFELHKFGIFWNLHQPKGVPSPSFHQPEDF
jgi:hypothetical protein